uniref:NR LBD domain-containing protein n=1 Tax=Caenorhabditis tropicalis TaxID=1561998 RepID=A0A1I7SZ64_9PELO
MERIREIQKNLELLAEMDEHLENCEEWNIVGQEIVKKLGTIRKEVERSVAPTPPILLTPPGSCGSGSIFSDTSSSTDNVYTEAVEAYDQQIYSRCVRLVESANRESPVDMCLISLAHHSYSEMVNAASGSDDAMKFAKWWAEFLDSVEAGRGHSEKIELLDYEAVAYEKIVRLGGTSDIEKLIEVVVRSYEMVTLLNRPYHILSLQKLFRLAYVLHSEIDYESDSFSHAKTVVLIGIQNVIRDRKKFSQLGKFNEHSMKMCDELLNQIFEFGFVKNDENAVSFRLNSMSPIPISSQNNIVMRL